MASEIAKRIALGLFTNGRGEEAERLVLYRDSDECDLGGWCRRALEDRIDEEIAALIQERLDEILRGKRQRSAIIHEVLVPILLESLGPFSAFPERSKPHRHGAGRARTTTDVDGREPCKSSF